MKPQRWILGAGGQGRVVADAALACGRWDRVAFFDDAVPALGALDGLQVLGNSQRFFEDVAPAVERIVAIGHNARRDAAVLRCEELALALASVVHPAAVVSRFAEVGPGCYIGPGAVVGVAVHLAAGCIVNTLAGVDHDCELGRAVHVGPGANLGGGVKVGARSWLGIGCAVRHGERIGCDSIVGAGSVVVGTVGDNCTVVGNPARPMPLRPPDA